MRLVKWLLPLLLGGCAASGTIGGAYYDSAYDYGEFFAATDGRNFQVIMAGAPFPGLPPAEVQRALLPVMQAAKPRPNLTFTYAPRAPEPRLSLVAGIRCRQRPDGRRGVRRPDPPQAPGGRPALQRLRRLLAQRARAFLHHRLDRRHRRTIRGSRRYSPSFSWWCSTTSRAAGSSTGRSSASHGPSARPRASWQRGLACFSSSSNRATTS